MLRTGCFCIGPGIDFRSAVLALGTTGLGANTANLESIPGPIQKQPVSNTTFVYYKHKIVIRYDICFFPLLFPTNRSIIKEILYWIHSFIATTGFNIWKCQFGFNHKMYFTQDLTWLNHANIDSCITISRGTILFYYSKYNLYTLIHFVNCVFFLQNACCIAT